MTGVPTSRQVLTMRRWMMGRSSIGHSIAEVAAGDHDGVGGGDDVVDDGDGVLVLDLGDGAGFAAVLVEHAAKFEDVGGFAAEAEGDEIDADFDAECDVGEVLLGERGEIDFDAGQIDVAAGAEGAGGEDFAADLVVVLDEDLEVNDAVVDEHGVADVDVVDEAVVVHVDGIFFFAAGTADGEFEDVADLEIELGVDVAGADGGALGVEEDAGVGAEFGRGTVADGLGRLRGPNRVWRGSC